MESSVTIYDISGAIIAQPVLTSAAEREEELMKSDFVRLSWNDDEKHTLPAGAYIIPYDDGLKYTLLEPYEPAQQNETEWKYEPEFQHPKMYLGKVPFVFKSTDSNGDDTTLLEWNEIGFTTSLLEKFCNAINAALKEANLISADDSGFSYSIITTIKSKINDTVNVTFSSVDILSGLTATANELECEWHIDWEKRKLFFGHISLGDDEIDPITLKVGENVGVPSITDSREGYWNCFLSQGSTRNITRRVASGDYISSEVRLPLDVEKYPDGIIYTDGKGNVITKEAFIASSQLRLLKQLIYDDVYLKLDLYVYDCRERTRYLLDDDDNKVVDYYDTGGNPVYKKYATWYMRLVYPTLDSAGNVTGWTDFDGIYTTIPYAKILGRSTGSAIQIVAELPYTEAMFTNGLTNIIVDELGRYCRKTNIVVRFGDHSVTGTFIVYFSNASDNADKVREAEFIAIKDDNPEFERCAAYIRLNSPTQMPIVNGIDSDIYSNAVGSLIKEYSGQGDSIIISGKNLACTFKANNSAGALSSPLAGREFELSYHEKAETIKSVSLDNVTVIGRSQAYRISPSEPVKAMYIRTSQEYKKNVFNSNTGIVSINGNEALVNILIDGANHIALLVACKGLESGIGPGGSAFYSSVINESDYKNATITEDEYDNFIAGFTPGDKVTFISGINDDGDSGVEIKAGDYEIIFEEGDIIIPTTSEYSLIPRGEAMPSLKGNIVNLFNIVMTDDFVKSAKTELENETLNTIKYYNTDLNSYTFKSNPVAFEEKKPSLYIGRKITFNNGNGYVLDTRVQKLVTKLDFDFEQEITIGNQVIKGTQTQLKEDVEQIISGNISGMVR